MNLSFSSFLLLALILLVTSSSVLADDNQIGCGIFLPLNKVAPSTNNEAENRTFYNSLCSSWQCNRAVAVPVSELGISLPSSTTTTIKNQYVCVRGAEIDEECLVDTDCYAYQEDTSCKNVTVGVDTQTNTTLYGLRCTKHGKEAAASVAGFISVLLAALFWGSNFIPARTAKAGNGILFQLFMCSGILTVGFVVQVIRSTDNLGFTFYPSASVGGFLWAFANTLCVPLIGLLGMGLAVSIWCAGNMLFGFLSSAVGFWGLAKPDLPRPYLSYIAIVFGIFAFAFLSFVRPTRHDVGVVAEDEEVDGDEDDGNGNNNSSKTKKTKNNNNNKQALEQISSNSANYGSNNNQTDDGTTTVQSPTTESPSEHERIPLVPKVSKDNLQRVQSQEDGNTTDDTGAHHKYHKKNADDIIEDGIEIDTHEFPIIGIVGGLNNARIIGVVAAAAVGCVFGLNNDPVVDLMDNFKTNSRNFIEKSGPNGLDYVFSHFIGAFLTSLGMALLLAVYEKYQSSYPESKIGKLPVLFGDIDEPMKLIWPGWICGIGWGLAQTFSFYGETKLGMAISYPLVTLLPAVVSILWSLFYFKELSGRRNLMFLVAAFCAAGVCVALVVASRKN